MQLIGGVLEKPMLGAIFKGSNHAVIIDLFRTHPYDSKFEPSKFSIIEIAEQTGLGKNTVRAAVADLIEQGILLEDASHRMHAYSLNRDRLSRLAYLFEP
jgi:DNA-binding IclR family transcriptional regulator